MSDFEFLAGFYGLLLGLIVAELASKLADVIEAREKRPIGFLTPLLALVVLGDVTSFWLWVWSEQQQVRVEWESIYISTTLGILYYLAAALVFPRSSERWKSLDERYWRRKQWVLGGLLIVNAFVLARWLLVVLPSWTDFWFFFWIGSFFIPMIALLFTRGRAVDLALLGWLVIYYAVNVIPGLPESQWSRELGILSTSAQGPPK